MGLTAGSTGRMAVDNGLVIHRSTPEERVIALAGNPNVGKSTVFNELTGLNQHTGNWPGKTVANAQGECTHNGKAYVLVDIPGTYSLLAHSAEEEVARDFICFGSNDLPPDAVIVVCDATCLERNLNLVLQTLEITNRVVVCINLMDEAQRKHIRIDTAHLSRKLGVPVIGASARSHKGLDALLDAVETVTAAPLQTATAGLRIRYAPCLEGAVVKLTAALEPHLHGRLCARWVALRLLHADDALLKALRDFLGKDLLAEEEIAQLVQQAHRELETAGISQEKLADILVAGLVAQAEALCRDTILFEQSTYQDRDRKLDKLLTSRATGLPVMLLLLALVFWITISGANYPSQLLSTGLFWVEDRLTEAFQWMGAPDWLHGLLVEGMYRVLAWVVSVMLPPMAIFFPLFTLLEDLGYLPRVAFNLDKCFQCAHACGKQSLTMCMGLGCNAAGVVGCRIIDSPRERLIAIITNNFVPCNGRFPTLITLITIFFIGLGGGFLNSVLSSLILMLIILLGVLMTLLISRLLSMTILKGVPSSFTLELPPYRRPQIGKVIVRSILDRTLFVLGRAVAVAAPAGLLIWTMANISLGGQTLLAHCSGFLDPLGHALGMDGTILMAFILGFPANEIVLPIVIMTYMANGSLIDMSNLNELHTLLAANGWTWLTAACTIFFSLMHWPCSTTCLSIRKETKSLKWTAVSFAVPTVTGLTFCFLVATISRLLGFA